MSGNQRIRVGQGGDHLAYACMDERVAARPGTALVGAGFQRDIGRCTHCRVAAGLRVAQGHDLGVRATGLLGAALADHRAMGVHQHAAHARVWVGKIERLLRPCQRLRQVAVRGHATQGQQPLEVVFTFAR